MTAIRRLELRLKTGNRPDAGTDGDVFLGVAGREFNVDSREEHDDFEQNSDRTYIFGEGSNVLRPVENDPRSPWQTDTENLRFAPIYIRFEPGRGGDWNLERVELTVIAEGTSVHFDRLQDGANLWLGESRGKFLYLR